MSKRPAPKLTPPKRKTARASTGKRPPAPPAAEITAPPLSEGARKMLALAARKGITPAPAPPPPAAAGEGDRGGVDPAALAEELDLWRLNKAAACYLLPGKEVWRELSAADLKRTLKARGVHCKPPEGAALSDADRLLEWVGEHRLVKPLIEELAGYRAGVTYIQGKRALVQRGMTLIEPAAAATEEDWPTICALLTGLFREFVPYFFAWMKVAFESLRAGRRSKGQVLYLVGPPGCGKSRVQHFIITPLLGGRQSDPTGYITGETSFNSELHGSEHLLVEDPVIPTDYRSREHFGKTLKTMAANDSHAYHPKGMAAMTLYPFWRVTVSQNQEADDLQMIPPFEIMGDKLILLRCHTPAAVEFPETDEERAIFENKMAAELPFFARSLLDWQIPPTFASRRFGVAAFIDEWVRTRMHDNSNESALLECIDKILFSGTFDIEGDEIRLRPVDLAEKLEVNDAVRRASSALYKGIPRLGKMLAALAEMFPHRIQMPTRRNDGQDYIIRRPRPEPAADAPDAGSVATRANADA